MFHAIRKAKLEKALIKADFFRDCHRAETRIELAHFAIDNLTHKPQTAVQLFDKWEGNFRALIFVEINLMHWMVKNHLVKCKTIDGANYYYI
jgi:hypothetical protein